MKVEIAVVLAVEQHRRSCRSAGLESEEAGTLEAPSVGVRQPVRASDGAARGKGGLNRGVVDRKRKVGHVAAHLLIRACWRRRCRCLLLLLLLLGFLRRYLLCGRLLRRPLRLLSRLIVLRHLCLRLRLLLL